MNPAAAAALVALFPVLVWPGAAAGGEEGRRSSLIREWSGVVPSYWGEAAPGVGSGLPGGEKILALTFDACGGVKGKGYDRDLVEYLRAAGVPATLFLSGGWIEANPGAAAELAKDPLFEIASQGRRHRPCSATGRSAYGIRGTADVGEMFDEIEGGARAVLGLTGKRPRFYRPATAFSDEVCPDVAAALGMRVAGYSVAGDGGATFNAGQVTAALMSAPPGSIVLLHLHHPEGETAEGVRLALPRLLEAGFRFVRLSDVLGLAGAEARRPLGLAVVGGLVVSQALTLYITPLVYTYLYLFQQWLGHRRERVTRR